MQVCVLRKAQLLHGVCRGRADLWYRQQGCKSYLLVFYEELFICVISSFSYISAQTLPPMYQLLSPGISFSSMHFFSNLSLTFLLVQSFTIVTSSTQKRLSNWRNLSLLMKKLLKNISLCTFRRILLSICLKSHYLTGPKYLPVS